MGDLIKEVGLFGYLTKYPLNPINIILVIVLIGIIVLVINRKIRRKICEKYLQQFPNSATLIFAKQKIGNADYADNIRIAKLNNEVAHWFFIQPSTPAMYVKEGENTLELYSEWARGGKTIKTYSTKTATIPLTVKPKTIYTIEYHIPSNQYLVNEKVEP